jgi:hypothetical protein
MHSAGDTERDVFDLPSAHAMRRPEVADDQTSPSKNNCLPRTANADTQAEKCESQSGPPVTVHLP